MNRELFAIRLSERRKKCGYSSREDFAEAYNKRYGKYDKDSPCGGVLGTLKKYENPFHPGMPRLDIVTNMCEMLDCDIDFLLGKIDHPKHLYETMYKECGLSDRATEQLVYWKGMKKMNVVNMILESGNFDNALDHAKELIGTLPTYLQLSKILQEKKVEVYSNPKPEGGYPSLDNLRNNVKNYEIRYSIARLRLSDHLTFLIEEMERLSKEKRNL